MSRNSLVVESLKRTAPPPVRNVWAMSLALIGAAFGAPAPRGRETGR